MIEDRSATVEGLVCEVRVQARPETIFPFLVDADRMVQWMGSEATLDARPGGEFSVLVAGKHRARGEYLEIDPPRRVVFTFGWEGSEMPIPPGSSRVEIVLIPEGSETVVRLTHTELPEAARADHRHGWDHYVARLAARASGGDVTPDPWAGDGVTNSA